MNHAVMMIPEVMRLPFTFGLSGALHVAALSSVVLPPPHVAYVSTPPIQVRLQLTSPVTQTSIAGLPVEKALFALKPATRKAARDSPIAALAATTPIALATLPPTDTPIAAKAIPIEHATPSPAVATVPILATETRVSVTHAVKVYALEAKHADSATADDNVAIADAIQSASGGDPERISGEADGTIDSPFNVPKAVYAPLRKYPEEARWERRTGEGSLGFRLKPDGSVEKEIKVLRSSGHADLDAAAVESLRRWRFALPLGAAPSSWYRYPFRFGIS